MSYFLNFALITKFYIMKNILFLLIMAIAFASCGHRNVKTEEKKTEVAAEDIPNPKLTIPVKDTSANNDVQPFSGTTKSPEARMHFTSGTRLYEQEDWKGGVEEFKAVIDIDPENTKAYYNMGLGQFHLEDFAGAAKSFTYAININPEDTLSLLYRGKVYYMLNDFLRAMKDYERALEINPDYAVAYYNRGTVKGQLKNYVGAINDFDKALALDPDNGDVYYNRGLANWFLGKKYEACYDWQKSLDFGFYGAEKALKLYCQGNE